MDEDDELSFLFEEKINNLAALFYQSHGRKFMPDYEFKNANHPEEKGCWNKAIIAFAFINEDNDLLKFQV